MDATDERIRRCEEALEGLIRMYRIYWLFRDNLGFDKMKAEGPKEAERDANGPLCNGASKAAAENAMRFHFVRCLYDFTCRSG